MRRTTFVIIVLVGLAIIAALTASYQKNSSGELSAATGNAQAAVDVPFTRITEGLQSSVTKPVNYLITSESELAALWKIVKATGEPPSIDFTQEAVIAVFAGERPTAGYSIAVSKVADVEGKRLVTISLMQPASDCVTAQVITAPYEILRLPATPLPLTHEDTVATVNCSE